MQLQLMWSAIGYRVNINVSTIVVKLPIGTPHLTFDLYATLYSRWQCSWVFIVSKSIMQISIYAFRNLIHRHSHTSFCNLRIKESDNDMMTVASSYSRRRLTIYFGSSSSFAYRVTLTTPFHLTFVSACSYFSYSPGICSPPLIAASPSAADSG